MANQVVSLIEATSRPRWFQAVLVIAAIVALGGVYIGWDATSGIHPDSKLQMVGFGTVAAAVVIALVIRQLVTRRLLIDVEGIQAGSTRIQWSEPHDFFYLSMTEAAVPVIEKVLLKAEDGRTIEVENIDVPGKPNAAVPKVVEQYSTAANWPKIRARIEAGEEVSFGPVTMSKQQIKIGEVTHSLERRVTLQMDRGKVKVGTEGKWRVTDVHVRDIANYPSLLKAIGQVAQALPPG